MGHVVDLVDQAVDLGPATASPLEVVSRMGRVHRGRDEHSVTGGELPELFSVHGRTVANVSSLDHRCATFTTDRRRERSGEPNACASVWTGVDDTDALTPATSGAGTGPNGDERPKCMTRRESSS